MHAYTGYMAGDTKVKDQPEEGLLLKEATDAGVRIIAQYYHHKRSEGTERCRRCHVRCLREPSQDPQSRARERQRTRRKQSHDKKKTLSLYPDINAGSQTFSSRALGPTRRSTMAHPSPS